MGERRSLRRFLRRGRRHKGADVKTTIVIGLAVILALSGCSATKLMTLPMHSELTQEPPISQERTAEVGDTLVRSARVTQAPALYLKKELVAKGLGMFAGDKATVKTGILPARYSDASLVCYISLEPVVSGSFLGTRTSEGGICESKSRPGSYYRVVVVTGSNNGFFEPIGEVDVERTTYTDKTAPGFSQELIYNGKTGDTVKFLYREFASDMARPAFDQEVTYDLREGSTIGFKGARVEILEATNLDVRYRVLAHFPLQQSAGRP
jgi:hypothetical protein